MTETIRILMIDDHPMIIEGYQNTLQFTKKESQILDINIANNCDEAVTCMNKSVKTERPYQVLFVDISLPPSKDGMMNSGEDLAIYARKILPKAKIIILTAYNDEELIINCIKMGAVGYAIKSAHLSNLVDIIRQVSRLGAYIDQTIVAKLFNALQSNSVSSLLDKLTFREKEIVSLVEKGLSYKQMSEQLFLTTFTVNYHLKNIYKKLKIHSKSELLSKLIEERKS